MPEWCSKHNRNMLVSKYPNKRTGEQDYWCPDCHDEWKKEQGFRPAVEKKVNGDVILADEMQVGFKNINERLDKIDGRIDKQAEYLLKKLGN